ncbi:MAG: hypothetical protein FWG16_01205 [Micrococcales bacterium]|nr:hypothetical protein [Micrococcales bacterium]
MRGFHLVGPIEAWLEVARHATHEELVQIGDGLVRYQNPITSLGAIRQFLNQPGGGLPTSRALAALADMRQGTDSIAETIVRRWIVTSRLPEPQVNRILTDADGQFMARVDCFIEQYQTVAEYDGMVHEGEHSRTRDNIRRDLLRRNGIEVVVATRADLADPSRFLQTLLAALSRQAKALRLPIPQMSPLGLGK